jgi:guanylate kinase
MGFNILPSHTTRPLRSGEANGLDMVSVEKEAFVQKFSNGEYLEPDLDFALLKSTGVYYGTPKSWLGKLNEQNNCAMPTSLTVARNILERTGVQWVHLACSDDVRRERLQQRNISKDEISARLYSGESILIPNEADIVIDTSEMAVSSIMKVIQGECHE